MCPVRAMDPTQLLGAWRILILSPHIDDEVLGCHAFLSPHARVCYFGVEDRPEVSARERILELEASAAHKGFTWELLRFTVNQYPTAALITPIEEQINRWQPTCVLIPHPSYNQDHRAVHDAAWTALRPHDRNWFVPVVLVYEQPHVRLWPAGPNLEPNFFVPVDLDDKLATYRLYRSQVRGHRPPDVLEAIAKFRGAQAGLPYAEGYVCMRLVLGERTVPHV